MRARVLLLALVLAMGVALIAVGVSGTATAIDDSELVYECAEEPNEDFDEPTAGNETLGWFDGYWYDEPLDIDVDDGLTPAELEQLSARTAARLEAMRCLPFEEMPDIEIIDRETFAEEQAESFDAWDERSRQFDNQQFETLLTIGSDQDSVTVREESQGATVGGYYDILNERIVVVSDDPDSLTIDEAILAHELAHALQDQHFNLSQYERHTKDLDNGKLGVIEGDVTRLELDYRERCEADAWNQSCMTDEGAANGGAGAPPNWAYYFMVFQPYSDGPSFVEHVYEQGGWEAVNALYEEMPTATTHTIEPENYETVDPEDLHVPDRSTHDWQRLTWETGPDYNVIGQAGMSSMLMGQSAEAAPLEEPLIPPDAFQNIDGSGMELDSSNPFNYHHDETDGWMGDRLYVYANDENETASVWKTAWEDADEMENFLGAYEDLAAYRGGEEVSGYEHTWTFRDSSEFDKAVTLYPDDDRLWIITAPTTGALDAIHQDIEPLAEDRDVELPPPGAHDGVLGPINGESPGDEDDTWLDSEIPGFGAIAAIFALVFVGVRVVQK